MTLSEVLKSSCVILILVLQAIYQNTGGMQFLTDFLQPKFLKKRMGHIQFAEVFGSGIDMWLGSQGSNVRIMESGK